jgi:hypothetical protein
MNKLYLLIRDLLIAIFGGMVGAIFGLYGSSDKVSITNSLILILIYAGIIGLIIFILDLVLNRKHHPKK